MSEGKQRSGIFKFFYIVLSVITFPIFVILFILRHPFWILFFLCLIAGGVAYYPISQGVKPANVVAWYQQKYQDLKFEMVTKAVENGETAFIPQAIVDEVVKTKKKMEEEKLEAARPKSENYNENISRDKKVEAIAQDLKKRKSGFKKQNETEGQANEDGGQGASMVSSVQNADDNVVNLDLSENLPEKLDASGVINNKNDVKNRVENGKKAVVEPMAQMQDEVVEQEQPQVQIQSAAEVVAPETENAAPIAVPTLQTQDNVVEQEQPQVQAQPQVQIQSAAEVVAPETENAASIAVPTLQTQDNVVEQEQPQPQAQSAAEVVAPETENAAPIAVPTLQTQDEVVEQEQPQPQAQSAAEVVAPETENAAPIAVPTLQTQDEVVEQEQPQVQAQPMIDGPLQVIENVVVEENVPASMQTESENIQPDAEKTEPSPSHDSVYDDVFSDEAFKDLQLF